MDRRATEAERRLGRYLIFESLGAGGMGEVHRARAFGAEGVVKDLCIKRIRAERLERPGAVPRFVAEARLSMRLAHGNIVPVFDFGRVGDEYYLAMEWVDGADLRALLDALPKGQALEPEVAAHVAAEVARALAYAHGLDQDEDHAVVHGDVKPANVLVSRAGDVKLTDFGVATAAGGAGRGGTPRYMPPEQREGRALDARSDVYSLGVLLAELLTGRCPETGWEATDSRIPEELAALIRRMLSPDPDGRPSSAREVATPLERFVGKRRGEGCAAPRDVLGERASTVATAPDPKTEGQEIGPDASFARDGMSVLFADRMGATSMTASATTAALRPKEKEGGPLPLEDVTALGGRRGWMAALLALAVLAAAGLGAMALRTSPGETPEEAERVQRAMAAGSVAASGPRADPPAPVSAPTRTSEAARTAMPFEPARTVAESPTETNRAALTRLKKGEAERAIAAPNGRRAPPKRAPKKRTAKASPPTAAPAPATLSINAIPWATVHLDGKKLGNTPLFRVPTTAGEHVLSLTNEPMDIHRESRITLRAGDHRDVIVDLR